MSLSSEVSMIALSTLLHAVACQVEITPWWRSNAWDDLHMQTVDSNRLSLEAFSDICAHVAPCHCTSNHTQSSADNKSPWTPPSLHGLNKGNLVWCIATWIIFVESSSWNHLRACPSCQTSSQSQEAVGRHWTTSSASDLVWCIWQAWLPMPIVVSMSTVYCFKRSANVWSKVTMYTWILWAYGHGWLLMAFN